MPKETKQVDHSKAVKKAIRAALDGREKERRAKMKAALNGPGDAPKNVLADFAPFAKFDRNGLELDIVQTSIEDPSWDADTEKFVFDLTKRNMYQVYTSAPDWGWSDKKKRAELFTPEMRFLIAKRRSDGVPLGFVAFTFLLEDEYDILYLFELQLVPEAQRKGLGKHLMQVLELTARKQGMQWVFLTVLKANTPAFTFYMSKMKYDLSDLSPSRHGQEASHEILAKCVDAPGWNKFLEWRQGIIAAAQARGTSS